MEKTPGTALSRMDAAEVRVQNFMVVCGGLSIFCFVRPDNGGVLPKNANCVQEEKCHNQSREAEELKPKVCK
jgi:hypothetical protein